MSADQFANLLAALVGAPSLPGARCRGKPHTFDEARPDEAPETTQARHAQALGLCRSCPALASCQRWFNDLPRAKRPSGVVAGQITPIGPGRPRKETA